MKNKSKKRLTKKLCAVLLSAVMALGCCGSAMAQSVTAQETKTYDIKVACSPDSYYEFAAYNMTLTFTVSDGKLTAIAIKSIDASSDDYDDDMAYTKMALNGLSEKLTGLASATTAATGIDTVSHATCSSNAILKAYSQLNTQVAADSSDTTASKASQSLKSTVSKTVKYTKVKKKAQTFKLTSSTVGASTAITCKATSNKNLSVAKNGTVTVKKGTAKGTYKIKVKVTAAADSSYEAATKTVTVKVTVK